MRTVTALALAAAALLGVSVVAHPAHPQGTVLAGGFEWTHGGGR